MVAKSQLQSVDWYSAKFRASIAMVWQRTKMRRFPQGVLLLTLLPTFRPGLGQTPISLPKKDVLRFNKAADKAFVAMQRRAAELKITGVAVVSCFDGSVMQSWQSRALVVGRLKDEPRGDSKGNNLLAIAYAKASEMADTLQNSGSQARPPMTGEVGWTGGVISTAHHGYVIAAFSGGKSEDDVEVSKAGLKELAAEL